MNSKTEQNRLVHLAVVVLDLDGTRVHVVKVLHVVVNILISMAAELVQDTPKTC